jgi:hypothetical protein
MALTFHINANQQRCDVRKLWYAIFDQVNVTLFNLTIKSRVRKKTDAKPTKRKSVKQTEYSAAVSQDIYIPMERRDARAGISMMSYDASGGRYYYYFHRHRRCHPPPYG